MRRLTARRPLQQKVSAAREGHCCGRRPVLCEKVNAAREGRCCERRSVLREKVSAAREGQCCERRPVLREEVSAAREGQCCERRSVLRTIVCTALLSTSRACPRPRLKKLVTSWALKPDSHGTPSDDVGLDAGSSRREGTGLTPDPPSSNGKSPTFYRHFFGDFNKVWALFSISSWLFFNEPLALFFNELLALFLISSWLFFDKLLALF